MALVEGNGSNNTLFGTTGRDQIFGRGGSDVLSGGRGDDVLDGGIGFVDHLVGGADNDTYIIGDTLDVIHEFADGGEDTMLASVSSALPAFVENLTLTGGATIGVGNELDNIIVGNGNDNTLIGGRGDDRLDGGGGTDTADFSHWDDAAGGVGASFDLAVVFSGAQLLARGRFDTGPTIRGGGESFDVIEEDTLVSIENIRGTNFDDSFRGNAQDNTFWGRGGDDEIFTEAGRDTYDGGSGVDTVSYNASSAVSGIVVSIDTGIGGTGGFAEGDLLWNVENVIGTSGNDTIFGNGQDNRLFGGRGDDNLTGGDGDDTLVGGAQVDIDRMAGGAGHDTFLYMSRDDSRNAAGRTGDAIADFNVNEDLIDLHLLGINGNDILIQTRTVDGVNFATVTEDINHSGGIDAGEFSINIRIEGAGFVTAFDIVI